MPPARVDAIAGWPCRDALARQGRHPLRSRKDTTVLGTILIVVLVLMLLGVLPTWSHSRSWGYAPSGTIGLILVILIVLVLTGRL